MTTHTFYDNRNMGDIDRYQQASIEALRDEIRRLVHENEILREQQRAFANRLSEVLRKQAGK